MQSSLGDTGFLKLIEPVHNYTGEKARAQYFENENILNAFSVLLIRAVLTFYGSKKTWSTFQDWDNTTLKTHV